MIFSSTEELATIVKEQREKRGMSQRDLARSAGVGNATISCLEKGSGTNVSLRTFLAIAGALGIDIDINRE